MSTAPRSRRPSRPASISSRISRPRFMTTSPSLSPPRARKRRSHRSEGYALPRKSPKITLTLSIFHNTAHTYETTTLKFDPNRINDRELWEDIRATYRAELEKPWRRILGFRRVKQVVPCTFSHNNIPLESTTEAPKCRQFTHAYHHPRKLRSDHVWIDWFVEFDRSNLGEKGLEFKEGLWAEKLVILAVLASVVIVAVCIIWCLLGGNLQTVSTVMSFVLSLIAAQIALAALYFQVAQQ